MHAIRLQSVRGKCDNGLQVPGNCIMEDMQ